MYISRLTLQNFRGFKKNTFSFSPTTTVIIGQNATGKTNILEAIFLLSLGKSFRAELTSEMIAFGKEIGRVSGVIKSYNTSEVALGDSSEVSGEEETGLEIVLTKGEVVGTKTPIKKYSINGVGKRMFNFIGRLKVVLFWPEDLELVTDSPSLRRKYLDHVLLQVDREYRRTLISYEKGLRQRNKLLEAIREGKAQERQLLFWDQLLVKHGEYISRKREEYIHFINQCQMSNVKCQMSSYQLVYDQSPISSVRLEQYQEQEIAVGATLVGPHRDDIKFKVQSSKFKVDRDLTHYGSRGEQRLAILWLKLAELAYIEKATGENPVLLLDDIFSELDSEHRKVIFDIVGNQQTILTTTDHSLVFKDKLQGANIIKLS